MQNRGRFRLPENVTYRLTDKNGRSKTLFQPNWLGEKFFKAFGYLPKVPVIFGMPSLTLQVSNLVTNAGMAGVASRINGSGGAAAFTYIALGTGTTAAAVTDTTLQTEITTNGGQRAGATVSLTTTDVTNDTATLTNTWIFTGSFTLTETGVFNAASAGTMLSRQVFAAVNVVSGDAFQVTWNFDVD